MVFIHLSSSSIIRWASVQKKSKEGERLPLYQERPLPFSLFLQTNAHLMVADVGR